MTHKQDVQEEVAKGTATWEMINHLLYEDFPLICAHLNRVASLLDTCIESIRAMDPKLEVPENMILVQKATFITNWFSARLTAQMALEEAQRGMKRK